MSRLERKSVMSIADAIKDMFRESHAWMSHNTRRVYSAWDEASGAGDYTIRRFFRDGILYITMKSSVFASQLAMQKGGLLEKINAIIAEDPLFIKTEGQADVVREIRIK